MKHYPNFYENLPEALKRIKNTVVLYDGQPWFVLAVTAHKPDGIFRVYMEPIWAEGGSVTNDPAFPQIHKTSADNPVIGPMIDEYMDKNPEAPVIRKQMSSPLFKRFKPFPLGMCNEKGRVIHVERGPTRRTEQGLTSMMMSQTTLSLLYDRNAGPNSRMIDLHSRSLLACIMNDYPDVCTCFDAMNNTEIANTGVAYARQFALIKGPIGMLFLAYKNDIVGVFPHNDGDLLKLGENFKHLKEVITENNSFGKVI